MGFNDDDNDDDDNDNDDDDDNDPHRTASKRRMAAIASSRILLQLDESRPAEPSGISCSLRWPLSRIAEWTEFPSESLIRVLAAVT